jgi:hypothetical protein
MRSTSPNHMLETVKLSSKTGGFGFGGAVASFGWTVAAQPAENKTNSHRTLRPILLYRASCSIASSIFLRDGSPNGASVQVSAGAFLFSHRALPAQILSTVEPLLKKL